MVEVDPKRSTAHVEDLQNSDVAAMPGNKVDAGVVEDLEISRALATDQDNLEDNYFLSVRLVGSVSGLALAALGGYWGFGPPASVVLFIDQDIGPSGNASLFSVVWTFSTAVAMLVNGRLSDKLGRRWFVIGASVLGIIGAIVAAVAQNMNTLIGANVLMGLSGGVQLSYALFVGEIVPNKYKVLALVAALLPNIAASVLGAYFARRLVAVASWRWLYYIYIIIMVPTVGLLIAFYRPPSFKQLHQHTRTFGEELKRADSVGLILSVSGVVLFILGVSFGGQRFPWISATVLSCILIGGCLLIAFAFWEVYGTCPNPVVPMHYFRDVRGYTSCLIQSSMGGGLMTALAILWPQQVQQVYGYNSGWEELAWMGVTIGAGAWGGTIIFGSIFHLIKHIRIQLTIGFTIVLVFISVLSTCGPDDRALAIACSFLAAVPVGFIENVTMVLIQLGGDDADLGTIYSSVGSIRTASGSIFTAVFVAILSAKIPPSVQSVVPPAVIAAGLPESSLEALFAAMATQSEAAFASVPGFTPAVGEALRAALAMAYSDAYKYVYYAALAFGCVGWLCAVTMKNYDPYLTTHVPRKIYKKGEMGNSTRSESQEKKGIEVGGNMQAN